MKFKILFIKTLYLSCLMIALGSAFSGCSDDDEGLQSGYGYAQFKLFKSGSYQSDEKAVSRAGTNELEYLREAQKMEIVLIGEDGKEVIQTVGLNPMGSDSELGLRSEKLKLMAGRYTIIGFYLYKIKGQDLEPVLSGEPQEHTVVTVVDGGLAVQDIAIKVVERGRVKFTLKKEGLPVVTRGVENADNFIFSDVKYVSVSVRDEFTKKVVAYNTIPCEYTEKIGADKKGYAIAVSDSLLFLKAGTYSIYSYSLYDKNKKFLDGDLVAEDALFEVSDNVTTEAEVPVMLHKSAAYIQDYIALRIIWEELDGPNWRNSSIAYPIGVNWNFNKEMDMWGDQPGVVKNEKGRIVNIDLGSFGARGDVPKELGLLTELKILSLGTHSDAAGGDFLEQLSKPMTREQREICRNDYYNRFLKKDLRADLSEPIKWGLQLQGKPIDEQRAIGLRGGASTRDVSPGHYSNGIEKVPKEIENLTKLQQLYIANGKFTGFAKDTDLSQLKDLTDMELYNCPLMTKLPDALFTLPNLALLNLANNPQIASADFEEGLEKFADGNSKETIQILYLGNNKLTTIPANFINLKKIAKLDCTHNQITHIPAFGRGISFVQLTMDYNKIKEIPLAADGYFCNYEDIETFSFANNEITEFPNTFDAKSPFTMGSIDFSYNKITHFQGGDQFRGMNTATLSLTGNQLKTFPGFLFNNGSRIDALLLRGNGMTDIPDGSFKGSESYYLVTLDLSNNLLDKLPKELEEQAAVTLPYLYGVDLSNNRFSKFPTGVLNVDHLTTLVVRNQRDAKGNRLLRDWPKGISMCPSLRILCLGGNDFRKIDDTISPNIFMFEIKDNPNISIDLSGVCNYIQAGYYQLIYDPWQDIRGCDILDLDK